VGRSYRLGRGQRADRHHEIVDGVPNWRWTIDVDGLPEVYPQRGIYAPASVRRNGRHQLPFIICTSSPHKYNTDSTPWADEVNAKSGMAIYYGDAKATQERPAAEVSGNRMLTEAWRLHKSVDAEDRLMSPPVILWTTHGATGPGKGYRWIEGIAVVDTVDLVMQEDPRGRQFENVRFGLRFVDLEDDSGAVNSTWLNSRRLSEGSLAEQLALAPYSWQRFVKSGVSALHGAGRRPAPLRLVANR